MTHKIDTLIVSVSGQTALDIATSPSIQQLLLSEYLTPNGMMTIKIGFLSV